MLRSDAALCFLGELSGESGLQYAGSRLENISRAASYSWDDPRHRDDLPS